MSAKAGRASVKNTYLKGGHEVDFKPAKVVEGYKHVPKPAYPYICG
jgi:hypothetical protein